MSNPAILIVEDEEIVSADIANKLRKLGYEVAGSTGTGEEAIEIARRQRPSLVLMDIRLAGPIDGIAAAEAIRQEFQVPVVFLTAHADKATIQRAKQAEAFGYILKPFDDREMHTQIEMALYKHAAERRLREIQARLAIFAAATFEGIIEIEAGRIVDCNAQFARILAYPETEMRGMEIANLISPEDRDRVMANIHQERESKTEHGILRKDGARIIVEAHGRPLSPGRRITAIRDITDRKKLEEALQESHDKLEQQVAERTTELVVAMEKAEKRKQIAENALSEIKKLKNQLEAERAYLQEEIQLANNHENIIGQSDGLKYVLYKAEQIAGSDTTVLVLGETGTGKELVARAIHGLSTRKNRALVKVNCAALPSNLIESELFGHEKGAYTGAQSRHLGRFEVANGGTLFLDEIGELPLDLQPKLLRVLQDGEFERLGSSSTIKVNVRIVAVTNRNLEEEVRKGHFREDLWYRLNVFPITMPPLRDRMDDIPLLVDFYVKKISKRMGKAIEIVPAGVMNALQDYHWPGNVRELENVLERAVIDSSGPKLRLVDELKKSSRGSSTSPKTLEAVEREHIIQTLVQAHWKVGGKNSAAEILGLDRSTLRARMRKLDIQKP
jgi:chemotaxis protein methyltransferase CheR